MYNLFTFQLLVRLYTIVFILNNCPFPSFTFQLLVRLYTAPWYPISKSYSYLHSNYWLDYILERIFDKYYYCSKFTFQLLVRLYTSLSIRFVHNLHKFTFQLLVRLYTLIVLLFITSCLNLHSNYWLDYIPINTTLFLYKFYI